jgi:hypothetical protein
MKYLLGLFALLVADVSLAQISTNIYFTSSTDLPVSETIYYSKNKKLTWLDFTAEPIMSGNVGAITMSGFGYKASLKKAGDKGQLNIAVYCYFTKNKSWVKPNAKTGYILQHEQGHFDISYLASQLFIQKARELSSDAISCNKSLPELYKSVIAQMHKMQTDYDTQTMNGRVEVAQEKWNSFFAEQLLALTD